VSGSVAFPPTYHVMDSGEFPRRSQHCGSSMLGLTRVAPDERYLGCCLLLLSSLPQPLSSYRQARSKESLAPMWLRGACLCFWVCSLFEVVCAL
jgi:hypothetical protein